MRAEVIARNYAETLFALAERNGGRATAEEFLRHVDELAGALEREPRLRQFLETPRVPAEAKKQALRAALAGRAPELFIRFLMVVVEKRRQGLLREIAAAYRDLVDEMLGRVRVRISISHEPDAVLQEEIGRALAARLGKTVVPTYTVDPDLLGGMVVRVGDEIFDGSVRSRAAQLRRRLLEAGVAASAR